MLLHPGDWSLDQGFAELRGDLEPDLEARLSPETHGAAIEYESAPCRHAGEAVDGAGRAAGVAQPPGSASTIAPSPPPAPTRSRPGRRPRSRPSAATATCTSRWASWPAASPPSPCTCTSASTTPSSRSRPPTGCAPTCRSCWRCRPTRPTGRAATAAWRRRGRRSSTPSRAPGSRAGSRATRDYVETLETLIDCGAFPEPNFVWWDLRLRPSFGTLEIRVMDTQTELWRTAALAALAQSLVRLEALDPQAPEALVEAPELLEESRFRAARDGVRAELLDPVERRAIPVAALAELAVEAARPHASELGCEPELDRVAELVDEPADQSQRAIAGDERDLPRAGGEPRRALQLTAGSRSRRSTARAQRRPSAIAVTISDWPTRASPAAQTLGARGLERLRGDVAAAVELEPERGDDVVVGRVQEADRDQHQVGRDRELAAGDRLEVARGAAGDAAAGERADPPAGPLEPDHLVAEAPLAALVERVGRQRALRRQRPGGVGVAAVGGDLRVDVEQGRRERALAIGVGDAVHPGVAAADHDDVLAGGGDLGARCGLGGRVALRAGDPPVALIEVVHREVDAVQLAPRGLEVALDPGADRDHDRVVGLGELGGVDVDADVGAVAELAPPRARAAPPGGRSSTSRASRRARRSASARREPRRARRR